MTTYANPGPIGNVPPTPNVVETTWGNAIRDRVVRNFTNAAQRDAEITSPIEGMFCYLASTHQLLQYCGATDTWQLPWGMPWGTVATPISTATAGTATSGTTETRDAVLGDYTFTAVANRRYRAMYDNFLANGSVAGDLFSINVRDGGSSSPTAASTLLVQTGIYIPAIGSAGRTGVDVEGTFTLAAGTHKLGVFAVRTNGTGLFTPISAAISREFYVEDIGPAGSPS